MLLLLQLLLLTRSVVLANRLPALRCCPGMESHLLRMLSLPVAQGPLSPARGGSHLPSLSEQPSPAEPAPPEPSLVVFSGGTAFNSVAGHMRQLTTRIAHVLPVSDDGGSTAEIVRVLGGPAVGDIRSRCLRLAGAQLLRGCRFAPAAVAEKGP